MSAPPAPRPLLALAVGYPSDAAAAEAYGRVLARVRRPIAAGLSAFRLTLGGPPWQPAVVLLAEADAWPALATVAELLGDGTPVAVAEPLLRQLAWRRRAQPVDGPPVVVVHHARPVRLRAGPS